MMNNEFIATAGQGRSRKGAGIFDLWAIIGEIELETSCKAQHDNLFWDFFISPDTPRYFQGDSFLLKNVIHLLVAACLKSIKSGGITVRIDTVGCDERNRHQLAITITDTSPGIHPHRLTDILDVPSRKSKSKGVYDFAESLFFVKRLARRLDGDVSIHSIFGWGTRLVAKVSLYAVDLPADLKDSPENYSLISSSAPH